MSCATCASASTKHSRIDRTSDPAGWGPRVGAELSTPGPLRFRDLLDRSICRRRIVGAPHEIRLRNDAYQHVALIDDRNAANLLLAHRIHHVGNVVVRAACRYVLAHCFAHLARRALVALRDVTDRDVAIGNETYEFR